MDMVLALLQKVLDKMSQLDTDLATLASDEGTFTTNLQTFFATTLPQIIADAVAASGANQAQQDAIVTQTDTNIKAAIASIAANTPAAPPSGTTSSAAGTVTGATHLGADGQPV